MCWLPQRMVPLFMGMLVMVVLPSSRAQTEMNNNSKCLLGDIETRLSIASEIIETAKRKLPKDLKDLCKNLVANDCNTLDRNETHLCDCNKTKTFECNETKISEGENKICYVKPLDCSDIYLNGERRNGLYYVWPQSRMFTDRLQVYCDMESNGGGWTVIQRRGDYGNSQDYFYRNWNAYKTGFGDMLKEFWIGNDNIFALTNQRKYQLRVNLTSWEEDVAYATYDEFWILDENANYMLHVKGYNGTAGDSLAYHDGQKFSTIDKKNDISPNRHCAQVYKGAWWYKDCYFVSLNGMFLSRSSSQLSGGVVWWAFKGGPHSLQNSVMKIRPPAFEDMRNRR